MAHSVRRLIKNSSITEKYIESKVQDTHNGAPGAPFNYIIDQYFNS